MFQAEDKIKIDHIDWIDEENRKAIVSVTDELHSLVAMRMI